MLTPHDGRGLAMQSELFQAMLATRTVLDELGVPTAMAWADWP